MINRIDPCTQYKTLAEIDRSVNVTNNQINNIVYSTKCDNDLDNQWYRFFGGPLSQKMHTSCVPSSRYCSTVYAGWMKEEHPLGKIINSSRGIDANGLQSCE